jgi:DNA-binding beta-propeller fold protein YncE
MLVTTLKEFRSSSPKTRIAFPSMRSLVLCSLLSPIIVLAEMPSVPRQLDGDTVLLPNQWLLKPVGRQLPVGDFPANMQVSPDGKFMAVLHCGHGQNEIAIISLATRKITSRSGVNEAFYGLAFSPTGNELVCSGSSDEVLHVFPIKNGYLGEPEAVTLREAKQRGIPGGIAIAKEGTKYVANVWAHSVSRVRGGKVDELMLTEKPVTSPSAPAPTTDDPSITKRAEAQDEEHSAAEPFPYACVLDEKRGRLYVSLWAQASVAVIDTKTFKIVARWKAEDHPNEMLLSKDGRRLFVANANRNSVSAIDVESGRVSETLIAALPVGPVKDDPAAVPPGNTPNSLALSPDGEHLFVANANINTVAVFDVEEVGKARSLGFIPVGWYPTSVRVSADGSSLLVANGKGLISKPNRNGPQPGRRDPMNITEYIGGLFQGTISFIDLPKGEAFNKKMTEWTARAFACVPDTETKVNAAALAGSPIPLKIGDPSPIKYCIYIVKENRTFDQVLGDLGRGNGDPTLTLFGEKITPNHHALAREFVCLDNFYVESEVSADGHEWSMGAYATDFVEKHWPITYGHNRQKKLPYPAEGTVDHAARPAGGYLWDRCIEAGVSFRSYGEWVGNGKTPNDPAKPKVKALEGRIDPLFRSFDTDYPDVKRAERFISELKRFEQEGDMPRMQIVRLPNDHTSGVSPGKRTPTAQVADNDLAFGQVIEALTHSKFWPQLAIFVVEDDAQNGPDHVDAHRTIAFAMSPYIKRGSVDSTLYSTSSMLRTMELILGLKPMSQFDAAALPMFASFQKEPDLAPYECKPVDVDMMETNQRLAWGAKESLKMDFTKEDAADDLVLNEVIWRSVRGANSPMPAPRRAAFVFTKAEEEDE